jgi:hypothetical protein
MERKAFNFYKSYYDVVLELPEIDRLPFLMAILTMQFEGTEPTNLSGVAKIAFLGQKHSIIKQIEGFKAGIKTDNTNKPKRDTNSHPKRQPDSHPDNKNKNKNKNKGNKPTKVSFQDSELIDKNKFKDYFPEWNKTKLAYYYDSAISYSLEGHKYVNWGAAVNNWAKRDELQGKLKFEETEKQEETEREYRQRTWLERNGGNL